MVDRARLNDLTRRIGKDIFARVAVSNTVPFSPTWWDDRLMDLSMQDEAVKLQMFRFVDVLPQLDTPKAIVRHLREYFAAVSSSLPGPARLGLRLLPSRGLPGRGTASVVRWSARRLARKFIAGSNLAEVTREVRKLRLKSLGFTVDLLGEATITEKEADVARDDYLEMIQGLTETVRPMPQNNLIDRDQDGPIPRVNVSVKLSALFSQFDPIDPEGTTNQVLKRLIPILESARKTGAFVNFDMEQYTRKDLTLSIFEKVLTLPAFRDWPDAGIAMQAYLRDTASDLKRLRDWAQKRGTSVVVRLVKGAYWDFETIQASQNHWPIPVWSKKRESDAEYERLSQFLLDNRQYLKPAFASHNIRSLSHAMAYARLRKIPDSAYEIQMLYGMADPIKEALVGLGQRVRVYTPYGELIPGMAYLVRRLLENTANDSFLRASFSDHVSEDTLLADPCQESPVLA